MILFGSLEGGRSVFASGGVKQALSGSLDRTGFVAVESGGFGVTPERVRIGDSSLPATRLTTQSNLLGGHQWNWPRIFVTALAGVEIQHEQLTVAGRVLRFSKPRYGLRAEGELWSNPTDWSLVTASTVASSARGSLWVRVSAGLKVGPTLFVGPEAGTYVTDTYREWRVGAHVTGFRAGILQGRLSVGWAAADDAKPGAPYVGATAWFRL